MSRSGVETLGLVEEAIRVTKDGKVAYFDECWKGIVKAFREVAGL